MRSCQELLIASGYADRPEALEELIRVLDRELRLVTPTAPEGLAAQDKPGAALQGKSYQLTHDYLVASLREWLTRKQKETRRAPATGRPRPGRCRNRRYGVRISTGGAPGKTGEKQ